jgi:hypothetical protein
VWPLLRLVHRRLQEHPTRCRLFPVLAFALLRRCLLNPMTHRGPSTVPSDASVSKSCPRVVPNVTVRMMPPP